VDKYVLRNIGYRRASIRHSNWLQYNAIVVQHWQANDTHKNSTLLRLSKSLKRVFSSRRRQLSRPHGSRRRAKTT